MAVRENSWQPYEDMMDNVKRDMGLEEVLPVLAVRVLCYIDPDGNQRYVVNHLGDVPLSTTLGMMELAKLDLYEWYQKGQDAEEA